MTYYTDNKRHLICHPYSLENLHKMAKDLGIPRHWFHCGDLAHYDIPVKDIDRIKDKCIVVSSKTIVRMIRMATCITKNCLII